MRWYVKNIYKLNDLKNKQIRDENKILLINPIFYQFVALINPNHIWIKYSLIVLGGSFEPYALLIGFLIYLLCLDLKHRPLSLIFASHG